MKGTARMRRERKGGVLQGQSTITPPNSLAMEAADPLETNVITPFSQALSNFGLNQSNPNSYSLFFGDFGKLGIRQPHGSAPIPLSLHRRHPSGTKFDFEHFVSMNVR